MTRPRAFARRGVVAGLLGVVLAGQAALYATLVGDSDLFVQGTLEITAGLLWLVAVWSIYQLRPAGRRATLLILGVGAVFGLLAVLHRPATSDDDYRYIWDGKVQLSGVDPYRYAPASPALERLRDPSMFGAPDHCQYPVPDGCTSINRPDVHTIYPPVAQAAFDVVRLVSGGEPGGSAWHSGQLPLQVAGVFGTLAVGWLLLRRARDRPWLAALWTWCPVTVIEFANNAHIDWLATLLTVLALSVPASSPGVRRGAVRAGALVGAAIAVKIYPVLALPALVRRSWWSVVAAVALVVLVYVPHVVAVGSDVIGYLPGYLHEEQYGSGGRLLLLGAVLPHPADTAIGVLVVAVVAAWVAFAAPRDGDPARLTLIVTGVAFLVLTPSYGWYAGLLLALVAMTGAVEWLPIVFAPTFVYLVHSGHDTLIYGVAALLALALLLVRLGRAGSLPPWLRSISPTTARSPSSR